MRTSFGAYSMRMRDMLSAVASGVTSAVRKVASVQEESLFFIYLFFFVSIRRHIIPLQSRGTKCPESQIM
jgi:hypothetical protein